VETLDAGLAVWPPLEHAISADAQPMAPIAVAKRRFTGLPSIHVAARLAASWEQVEIGRVATDPNFLLQPVGCLDVTKRRETPNGQREMDGKA
jgi:hypothetical protein